jgi:hypothetical protein
MAPIRVYISGPYSTGDQAENVARAMTVWHRLVDLGFHPYCPHLTHFLHMQRQRPYDEWIAFDLDEIESQDVVLRLPGESKGADKETERAIDLLMPVITGTTDDQVVQGLVDWRERYERP